MRRGLLGWLALIAVRRDQLSRCFAGEDLAGQVFHVWLPQFFTWGSTDPLVHTARWLWALGQAVDGQGFLILHDLILQAKKVENSLPHRPIVKGRANQRERALTNAHIPEARRCFALRTADAGEGCACFQLACV